MIVGLDDITVILQQCNFDIIKDLSMLYLYNFDIVLYNFNLIAQKARAEKAEI